jgi:hypothetical protein
MRRLRQEEAKSQSKIRRSSKKTVCNNKYRGHKMRVALAARKQRQMILITEIKNKYIIMELSLVCYFAALIFSFNSSALS